MTGLLHDYEALLQRTIGTNTLDKGSEAFSRLLKKKSRTVLEVPVTFQQRFRDKASDMLKLADVYPNIDGLAQQCGLDLEIRVRSCVVCHRLLSFHSTSLPDQHRVVGGEARTRGCGLPSYTRKVELAFIQTRMKDFTHIPQLFDRDFLITFLRFCESFSEES